MAEAVQGTKKQVGRLSPNGSLNIVSFKKHLLLESED